MLDLEPESSVLPPGLEVIATLVILKIQSQNYSFFVTLQDTVKPKNAINGFKHDCTQPESGYPVI